MANIAVITGGPGSGKTTLCETLSGEGISIGCESGRTVLETPNGDDLRRLNPIHYALEILKLDVEKYKMAQSASETWLCDRGFPDNAGFLDIMGLPRPNQLDEACRKHRYAGPVFVALPWKEIYHGDQHRIQDWQEAKATYAAIRAAWEEYGYELIELPKVSVEQRVLFVKQRLN